MNARRPFAAFLTSAAGAALILSFPPPAAAAAMLGDNPSECEIQAALLGKAGPDCPVPPPPPAPPPLFQAEPAAQPPAPPPAKPHTFDVPLPLSASFRITFAFASAEIGPDSQALLDRIAAVLTGPGAGKRYRIVGHTDSVGRPGDNLTLSLKRAVAVRDYFAARHGFAADALEVEGRGSSRLADPAHPTAAINRRVEIVNLGN
jgi:OmpA-OmpF porin, OOP family